MVVPVSAMLILSVGTRSAATGRIVETFVGTAAGLVAGFVLTSPRVQPAEEAIEELCGTMAGLAGAILAVVQIGAYVDGMIAGRGFIALAIVVFGGWRPWRVAAAALLFGVVDAFQLRLQVSGVPIPSPFLIGMPYILTIVVVAFVAGRAGYPAAINKPYPLRHLSRRARKLIPADTAVVHPLPQEHS